MRLGEMQPSKEYKFLQEQVFEGIWPFNKFQSPYNILLLTLIYLWWGFALFIIYNLSIFIFIIGASSAIGISLWTYTIFNYAGKMRDIEIEDITIVQRKFLLIYLDKLFNPGSIVIGVVMMTVSNFLLIAPVTGIETGIIYELQNQTGLIPLPILFYLYIFLISFDFCYRIGLITYFILIQFQRNFLLRSYLSNPKLRDKFSPRFIRALAKSDRSLYLVILSGILILPILYYDQLLLFLLIMYLFFIFVFLSINILYLFYLSDNTLSPYIINLLSSCKVAYVGTFSKNKTPHCTPMTFIFDGKKIYLATSIASVKIKNLRKINRITLLFDNSENGDFKNLVLEVQATTRIYGHNTITAVFFVFLLGFKMLLVRRSFTKKYPKYLSYYSTNNKFVPLKWRMLPILSRTLVEVIPYKMNYWIGNTQKTISL